MYLKITTRCNMSCAHCCYNCTEEGEDMSLEVTRKAFEIIGDEIIAIGGGEPTLHPLFWQILGESIANYYSVWLATNGSQTNIAIALSKMAKKGVIGCALSQDEYHDLIDPKVIHAFKKEDNKYIHFGKDIHDMREIRNTGEHLVNSGRCDFGTSDDCVCKDIIIEPDGTIKHCGCDDAPTYGTVFNPQIPDDFNYECHRKKEAKEEKQ